MSDDRARIAAYLRQLRELGERELFLEGMSAAEAVRLLSRRGAVGSAPTTRAEAMEAVKAMAAGGESPAAANAPGTAAADESAAQAARQAEAATSGATDVAVLPNLDALREAALGCTRCRLHQTRNSVVFGEGSPTAKVVVVGEAPGAEEDRTGRPFVGPAGKLLDLLLLSVGFGRDEVFICNVLKCRPPKNRDPKPDEVECCSPYLHRQLELIAPSVVLAVGKFAGQTLTDTQQSIGRLRGRVHEYRGVPLVATYHPAYLLRSPNRTRACWNDLQLLRKVVDEHA